MPTILDLEIKKRKTDLIGHVDRCKIKQNDSRATQAKRMMQDLLKELEIK
jgi:hypothetical protein